jgi:hypothetical protein
MGKERSEQIRSLLKTMAAEVGPDFSMLAQVKSVNEEEFTCDLYDEESELDFFDVRLRPVLDEKECLTIIPKVDSWVLAMRIEASEDWMIVAVGEADKWRLKIGEAIIEQDSTGLLIQKDADTLKQALTLIVEAVQKIVVIQGTNPDYAKLTQALTKVNNLLR